MRDARDFLETLRRDGWVSDPEATLVPLSGGVSSEIYLVRQGDDSFVVKRALPKLKVKDAWFADVRRNASEKQYIECVATFLPGAVPRIRFADPAGVYFGMEYLSDTFVNWKRRLLDGGFETRDAESAGRIIGEIHRQTSDRADLRHCFDTGANFHQLRLEPYLLTTGDRHPDLREFFYAEADRLARTRECLVHGDYSPKNILIDSSRMVVLDCEVAWYGDPVFDVAFLLNHLFLKALYHAPNGNGIRLMIESFCQCYAEARQLPGPNWQERSTHLVLLLMLARVDGKSPVEYLDEARCQFVRNFVGHELVKQHRRVATLAAAYFDAISALPPSTKRV